MIAKAARSHTIPTPTRSRPINQVASISSSPASTGQATDWNPEASGEVLALCAAGNALYAGGSFKGMGGQVRPYFARLGRLRDFFSKSFPEADWHDLSMGTSADFEVAVQEGATYVRVGTAILGPRPAIQV